MPYLAKTPLLSAACALLLAGCASTNYSPNTYSSNAVQLANKVESGEIVGYREVAITASGTIGAVTGGAAGGVLGAQYADSALAAVGGSAVGALVGTAIDHAAGDSKGWEYIVRKINGDMLSVTQREKTPLALGQKVLVIMGPQARVVLDYSVIPEAPAPKEPKETIAQAKPPEAPPVRVEVVLTLPPGISAQPAPQTTQAPAAPVASAQIIPIVAGVADLPATDQDRVTSSPDDR